MHEAGYVYKSVMNNIPPYFKCTEAPKISYTYTKPIAPSVFNYKQALQDFNSDCPLPTCSCSSSPYLYQPAGLNIVENTRLRELLLKGSKYHEPQAFTWRYIFKIIMSRAGRERLPFSSTWFHPLIIIQFDLFSESPSTSLFMYC